MCLRVSCVGQKGGLSLFLFWVRKWMALITKGTFLYWKLRAQMTSPTTTVNPQKKKTYKKRNKTKTKPANRLSTNCLHSRRCCRCCSVCIRGSSRPNGARQGWMDGVQVRGCAGEGGLAARMPTSGEGKLGWWVGERDYAHAQASRREWVRVRVSECLTSPSSPFLDYVCKCLMCPVAHSPVSTNKTKRIKLVIAFFLSFFSSSCVESLRVSGR